jgi:hypothetical protein
MDITGVHTLYASSSEHRTDNLLSKEKRIMLGMTTTPYDMHGATLVSSQLGCATS